MAEGLACRICRHVRPNVLALRGQGMGLNVQLEWQQQHVSTVPHAYAMATLKLLQH